MVCINGNYFDSFWVEHILKEIKKIMRNKNTISNIHKIQAHDLIMRGYFCIGFINFILKGKSQNNAVMFSVTKSLRWKIYYL